MSQSNISSTVAKLKPLDPTALERFCAENAEECSNEEIWRTLVAEVYPDIYKIAKTLSFPDWEEKQRSTRRKFMPMRELYTQLLIITTIPALLSILNAALDNFDLGAEFTSAELLEHKKDMDRLRIYYQMVSFVLSHVSFVWKRFLAVNNDMLIEIIPFDHEELVDIMTDKECRSFRFLCRYYGDTRVAGRHEINYAIQKCCRDGQTELLEFLLQLPLAYPRWKDDAAIRVAAKQGHTEIVKMLLSDPGVNPASNDNQAIIEAAEQGHTKIVKMLLVDHRVTAAASRAFWAASRHGHTEVMELLLAEKHVAPSELGAEAVVMAAEYGYIGVAKLLMTDSRINRVSNYTITLRIAFLKAFDRRYVELAVILLKHSLAFERCSWIALEHYRVIESAAQAGDTDLLEIFIAENYIDLSKNDNSVLQKAAYFGHLAVVKLLVADERVSFAESAEGKTLQAACEKGHVEIVKFLLAHPRLHPGVQNNSAIRLAAKEGHVEVVRLLLQDERVDPGDCDNQAIRVAAGNGQTAVVELLLQDKRVDPAALDNAAIRTACRNSHTRVVELLLADPRVDPSARDNEAFWVAHKHNNERVINLLLHHKCVDLGAAGDIALQEAAKRNNAAVIEFLLHDPRIDPTTGNNAALSIAASRGHLEVVQCLLRDPRVDPAANESAVFCNAVKKGQSVIVRCLLEDGRADPTANSYLALRWAILLRHSIIEDMLVRDPRLDPRNE